MHKMFSLTTMALLVLAFTATDAAAQAESQKIPFAQVAFVPCADGGAGENVLIEGTLHILSKFSFDANGGVHVKLHFQPQGATGTGLSTGDVYHATGVTQETLNINASGLPITNTFINSFKIIGEGPNNNLLIQETVHVTINENGELTANVVNLSAECR